MTGRTLAGDRAAVSEDIKRHEAYRAGWASGYKAAADMLGIDTDPVEALSTGQTLHHDDLLDDVVARQRAELAEARAYRTPARTPAQIRLLVQWSWREGPAQDRYARTGLGA